jgi:hypothetical protein
MNSDEPISAIFASIGAALGGITAGGVAATAAVASSAIAAGTSIAAASKKEPKLRVEAPPTVAKAAEAVGQERQRIRRGLNYKGTILSGAMDQAGAGGKSLLGQ